MPATPISSPYATFSTYAGNPYFIDLEMLAEDGLVEKEELDRINWGTNPSYVDYGKIYEGRYSVLRKAFEKGWERDLPEIADFGEENYSWLRDYALYMALKDHFEGKPWYEWPEEIRHAHRGDGDPDVLDRYSDMLRGDVNFYIYIQYLFYTQWNELREYAAEQGISFIGDVPIYVPLDSADVWADPELFQLDEDLVPTAVAGVPPDYFSEDGQLWGNPLYDWDKMKQTGYEWWLRRLEAASGSGGEPVRCDPHRPFPGTGQLLGRALRREDGAKREMDPGTPGGFHRRHRGQRTGDRVHCGGSGDPDGRRHGTDGVCGISRNEDPGVLL